MIVKSMSRKAPSFGQLIGYIDRDEGQEAWRIRHNVMSRDPERIREEFERNGALLSKRRNGVYLYHEIISITRARGLDSEAQKTRLREIAEEYIASRCPDNMVFGGLHQDKDHSYHYHLMISANRAGETGRLRLTKAQFREVQVQLERHVLREFPELEQKVAIDKRAEQKLSRGEKELERRTGKVPKKDQLRARVREALEGARDRDSLMAALGRSDLELYVRGQTLGVIDHETGKKHRLKTLDLELADRVEGVMMEMRPEPEQDPDIEEEREARRADARDAADDFADDGFAGEKEKERGERAAEREAREQPRDHTEDHDPDRSARDADEKSADREAGADGEYDSERSDGDEADPGYDRGAEDQAQGDARDQEDAEPREDDDDERFQGRDRESDAQQRWREEMERHRSEQRERDRDRDRSRDGPDLNR
ncbi:MAG: relaxase/mobilization nuclease domain-containing protein [Octadecabacter sp.]|nr:relaxase/mobilization nuclease domain-containing protein [Octadecabacter sp.]